MGAATFDALAYFEKLKEAGVPEAQAKIQANAFRDFSDWQQDKNRLDLASRGDIHDTRLEIEKVRLEIEKVRAEIESVRTENRASEIRLLKWQLGVGLALAAIMAKGFGWLGF